MAEAFADRASLLCARFMVFVEFSAADMSPQPEYDLNHITSTVPYDPECHSVAVVYASYSFTTTQYEFNAAKKNVASFKSQHGKLWFVGINAVGERLAFDVVTF